MCQWATRPDPQSRQQRLKVVFFARFWNVRMDGRTDNTNGDRYRPWLWVGLVDQFIIKLICNFNNFVLYFTQFCEQIVSLSQCHNDPPGRPSSDHIFENVYIHPSIPLLKLSQNKRNLKIIITTDRDWGSGRVDHWWHMSCVTVLRNKTNDYTTST